MLSSTQQILSNGDQSVKAQRRVWPRGSWRIFLQNLMQWKRWKHGMAICWDMVWCEPVWCGASGRTWRSGISRWEIWRSARASKYMICNVSGQNSTGSPCCLHFREQLFFLSWERCCNSGIYNALHLSSCPWRSLTSFSEFVGALFFCRADSSCRCSSANSRMYWSVWNEVVYPIALLCSACIRQGMPLCPWFSAFAQLHTIAAAGAGYFTPHLSQLLRQLETLFQMLRSSLPIQNRKFVELWAPSRRRSRCHFIRSCHSQAVQGRKSEKS